MTGIAMLFAGLTSAYVVLRGVPTWEHLRLPPQIWVNTLILLASSVTGTGATRRESRQSVRPSTVAGNNGGIRNRICFRPDCALAGADRIRGSSDINFAQFVLLRTEWHSRDSYPWRSDCTCHGFRQGVERPAFIDKL
jgi:hypothetical protein